MKLTCFLFGLSVLAACDSNKYDGPAGADGWLKGDIQNKFETVAGQLRGFDMAMVETGYRYQELYWAGQDENWDYAKYQADKIKLAIENGLERRPKRAKSAEHFLGYLLPEIKKSITQKDTASFSHNFQLLTAGCNSCHAMEKVPFFPIQMPAERQSPVKR